MQWSIYIHKDFYFYRERTSACAGTRPVHVYSENVRSSLTGSKTPAGVISVHIRLSWTRLPSAKSGVTHISIPSVKCVLVSCCLV